MNTGEYLLKSMNSVQVEAALAREAVLFLPIGTLEPHGRHLPVGTDSICAEKLALDLAEKHDGVVGPTIEYGITNSLAQTAPSSFFSEDLYENFLSSVLASYSSHGFKTIVILNGHGGNQDVLKKMARKSVRKNPLALTVINWWLISSAYVETTFSQKPGGHAAIEETAAIMHYCPELVEQANYNSSTDDYSPDMGIWHYPPPGEVLLKQYNSGQPCFDKELCSKFMHQVVNDLNQRLHKWLSAISRIRGGLRP